MTVDTYIAASAFAVALVSLLLSFYTWRRSFRPIVTVAIKTRSAGNLAIAYDLVFRNSGAIPAKDIRITALEKDLLTALSDVAPAAERDSCLKCFSTQIDVLQNADTISAFFGTTRSNDRGCWRYGARLPVKLYYRGWFGSRYSQIQTLQILDSTSFTGVSWG